MASRSWNRVELIGNLTRDPELRYTPNGAAVCTFGLATNRTYVSDGEKKEEVDFHRLVSWNKLAELCNQLLKKGNKVFISGRLQTRQWEAQDGAQRNVTEIVIEDMILLSPKTVGVGDYNEDVSQVFADKAPTEEEKSPVDSSSTPVEKKEEKAEKAEKAASAASSGEPKEEKAPSAPTEELADEDLPF